MEHAAQIELSAWEPLTCVVDTAESLVIAVQKGAVEEPEQMLAGTVLFLQEGSYTLTASRGASLLILCLAGTLPEQLLTEPLCQGKRYLSGGTLAVQKITALLEQESTGADALSTALFGLLSDAHLHLTDEIQNAGYPLLVETALDIIQEDFAEIDGVSEIADRLCVSESHLVRLFTRTLGTSPGKLLRKRRIEYAQELLLQPEISITLAGELAGFSDNSYFSRVFKQETGLTPGQFVSRNQSKIGTRPKDDFMRKLYL